jgi:sulfate adenylyltransferase subunit 1
MITETEKIAEEKALYIDYYKSDLLRLTTSGSVDDGKSTLIGRLLFDSKLISDDQLEAIQRVSEKRGDGYLDLSLLTDGLKAEREQGITIDVAYRYFSTPKRKFIISDTPGHIQYTRNMVTGASNANLSIILIDARKGLLEQTHRHTFIAAILKIKHLVVCVNKMDLVDYSENVFNSIRESFLEFSSKLSIPDIQFIPISALLGDNVVNPSENMKWYKGGTLLYTLENTNVSADFNRVDCRFPIQLVVKPQTKQFQDFRGFSGRIEGGELRPGDEVMVLPQGYTSKVKSIYVGDEEVESVFAPTSATITLEDEIDISRGDMIVKPNNQPNISQDINLMICWLNQKPLNPTGKYIIKHTTNEARCIIKEVQYKININTLHRFKDDFEIAANDIGRILIRTTKPLFYDEYEKNKYTGSVILIDEFTNETVAAGMIL